MSADTPASTSDLSAAGDVLLDVQDLKVWFPIKKGLILDRTVGHVKAVDGVSLAVRRGSTVGLVGESGCGKSTLGKAILRLVEPTGGTVTYDGSDVSTLAPENMLHMLRNMQMVFQDPIASLNPRHSVETILPAPLRAHGIQYD